MRGAHEVDEHVALGQGIIPADAGSTGQRQGSAVRRGDHPRGCGEHLAVLSAEAGLLGSSPRMRGALTLCVANSRRAGIIPADAGSTPGWAPCRP